jgi:hypothetical protein
MLRFPEGTGEQAIPIYTRGRNPVNESLPESQPSPGLAPFRRRLPPSMQLTSSEVTQLAHNAAPAFLHRASPAPNMASLNLICAL